MLLVAVNLVAKFLVCAENHRGGALIHITSRYRGVLSDKRFVICAEWKNSNIYAMKISGGDCSD